MKKDLTLMNKGLMFFENSDSDAANHDDEMMMVTV